MPFSYQIHPDQRLVVNTIQGRFSFDDYHTLMESILNDPHFMPGMHMFWDFTVSTLVDFSGDDLGAIKDYIHRNRKRRGKDYRVAFLVHKEVDFGLSRMYQMISEDLPVQMEVFKDRAQAEAWIKASRPGCKRTPDSF
jgi:hypothetical protein